MTAIASMALCSCEGLDVNASVQGKSGIIYSYDGDRLGINYRPEDSK